MNPPENENNQTEQEHNNNNIYTFINIISTPSDYLSNILPIFNLQNETKITNPNKAIELFHNYFNDIHHYYNNLNKQFFFAREIEHQYLVKFYKEIGIQDTDYEIKTKIKSLYVSVYIQKTIELYGPNKFLQMQSTMLNLLETQPNIIDSTGNTLPHLLTQGTDDITSLTRFYFAIKEAQQWQTHAKWNNLAFYIASMTVGERTWYGDLDHESLRRKHLFSIIEKIDNKYNKKNKNRNIFRFFN